MFKHVETLRVRWVDTDASGRIHYTAAFRYFEIAEWELFRRAGIPLRGHEGEFGLPRKEVRATFHETITVDDKLAVRIEPERMGNTSLTLTIEVFKEGRNCISGKVTVVFVGKDGRPILIPDQIRKALAAENR